ncbi:MAG: DegT/DnrJ/EryC1/StrS family aminotransferase [Candidatus Omnitrophica bacterium]|nr:DegT/DnrJ/EryC1/StrS family aminotransferase [Candidatus Omnitrophota bacterium]
MRIAYPDLCFDEVLDLKKAINSGWLTKGPYVEEFENMAKDYIGVKYAIAVNSGTAALHLALISLNISDGDEVIVPDFTFVATANAVEYTRAKPVFADIDLKTFNIDTEDIKRKITNRTKAIMPVHGLGQSADMDEIRKIARERNLFIIEDAACAMGAKYKGEFCGTMGDLGCFSFHPRKIITTAEGGMIITNNEKHAKAIERLRDHGSIKKDGRVYFYNCGYNYRLSELHSILGIAQMKKLKSIIARRQEAAKKLNTLLSGIDFLRIPETRKDCEHIFQSYVVLLDSGSDRDKFMTYLKSKNIETVGGNHALHSQPFYKNKYGYKPGEVPNSFEAGERSAALPLYPQMTDEEINFLAQTVRGAL